MYLDDGFPKEPENGTPRKRRDGPLATTYLGLCGSRRGDGVERGAMASWRCPGSKLEEGSRNDESWSGETIISVGRAKGVKTFQIVIEIDVIQLGGSFCSNLRCCRNRHHGNYIEQSDTR